MKMDEVPSSLIKKADRTFGPQTKSDLTREDFKPQRRNFKTMKVHFFYKDETWSPDLIDKSSLAQYNSNYKFILTVIDIFTEYAWALPLRNKSGQEITKAFTQITKQRKPEKL